MQNIITELATKISPIESSFSPATPQELRKAENELGIELPELLRSIQTTYGRFMFVGEALICGQEGQSFGIFTVFGCVGTAGNMVLDFQAHRDLQGAGLILIADDMFNNRYVWQPSNNSVFYIDYADKKEPVVVAKTLEEFFDRIDVIPD
jgi:hypothetical protein